MSTPRAPKLDRRHVRHEQTKREVITAAWSLTRHDGLAGLSLRALAREVGMEPPSLYTYFASKGALYDAMFAQANRELLERQHAVAAAHADAPALEAFRAGVHAFVEFCTDDAQRFSLMFQRTVPGFTPSEASMAIAHEVLTDAVQALARVGVTDAATVDLFLALTTGLASQQITNDPGGTRWLDLVDPALDMFLAHASTDPG